MKRIKRVLSCAIVLVAITGLCEIGSAAVSLHDPTWEAPGGYAQKSFGESPAHAGGTTWNYTDFDSTAYVALYYVIGDYDPGWTFNPEGPSIGTSFNGMTRLNYDSFASDLIGGTVVWTSSIYIYDAVTSSNRPYDARFTLSVYDGEGNPVSLLDASKLTGMDARVGGAHQIQGDFTANWLFELYDSGVGNWNAAIPFFDGLHTLGSDSLQSSVTRAFYYTPVQADINLDGNVDLADFAEFQLCFATASPFPDGCERADIDLSGGVDLADLALFEPEITGP